MAIEFKNDIDLDRNQIINVTIERVAGEPIPANSWEGRIIYDEAVDKIKFFDGVTWQLIGTGSVSTIVNGGAMDVVVTGSTVTLKPKVDNGTLEIASDALQVKDEGISTTKLVDGAVTTIKVTDKSITFAKIQDIPTMTVIGRTAGGSGAPSAITIINDESLATASHTNIATSQAVKAYVDGRVAGMGELVGGWDASTATGFPVNPAVGGTKKGDFWRVSMPGTVNGIIFGAGDLVQSTKAAPSTTDPADWIFIQANVDQATTTALGLVILATQTEVNDGSSPNKVVTTTTLAGRTATTERAGIIMIANAADLTGGSNNTKAITVAQYNTLFTNALTSRRVEANIGDGVLTTFDVAHTFGTLRFLVEVYDRASGKQVFPEIASRSTTNCQIKFKKAPTTNQYTVVLFKLI